MNLHHLDKFWLGLQDVCDVPSRLSINQIKIFRYMAHSTKQDTSNTRVIRCNNHFNYMLCIVSQI